MSQAAPGTQTAGGWLGRTRQNIPVAQDPDYDSGRTHFEIQRLSANRT